MTQFVDEMKEMKEMQNEQLIELLPGHKSLLDQMQQQQQRHGAGVAARPKAAAAVRTNAGDAEGDAAAARTNAGDAEGDACGHCGHQGARRFLAPVWLVKDST